MENGSTTTYHDHAEPGEAQAGSGPDGHSAGEASPARGIAGALSRPISRRGFLKLSGQWALATGAASCGTYTYARLLEPQMVEFTRHNIGLERLGAAFDGLRIAHMSDIHMDNKEMNRGRLLEIVRAVNAEGVDLVLLTGDYVTEFAERFSPDLVHALSALAPRIGTYGVLGNHDHWSGADVMRRMLDNSGVKELRNSVHTIERQGQILHICGLDDIWENAHRPDQVLNALPPDGAAILLSHEPDPAPDWAAYGRFALNLSGHSHGGQVRLPLLGALRLPPLGVRLSSGRYQLGNMVHYTSRGIGSIPPHVRFLCRPEIPIFTLRNSPSEEAL